MKWKKRYSTHLFYIRYNINSGNKNVLNILDMWIYLLQCFNLQPQPLEDVTVEPVQDDVEIEADEHTDAFVVSRRKLKYKIILVCVFKCKQCTALILY